MSEENVEVVRRILAAWRPGHPPVDSGLIDPGIEWVNPPYAVEPGVRRGVGSFGEAASAVDESLGDSRFEPERFIDAGEEVVVIGTMHVSGSPSTGLGFTRTLAEVWTLRDGRAVRFRWFFDEREALEAAGLDR